jgi:hypothetical protein
VGNLFGYVGETWGLRRTEGRSGKLPTPVGGSTLLLLCWHCSVSQVFLTIAAMLETEPMRCLLWFREAPAGILPAARMLATNDAGRRVW